VSAY
jgi:centrosomal protein CEP76